MASRCKANILHNLAMAAAEQQLSLLPTKSKATIATSPTLTGPAAAVAAVVPADVVKAAEAIVGAVPRHESAALGTRVPSYEVGSAVVSDDGRCDAVSRPDPAQQVVQCSPNRHPLYPLYTTE